MIDQSHNVTDPIESLMSSAETIISCYAKAQLVDRAALAEAQDSNDAMQAFQILRRAYLTDVRPMVASAGWEPAARSIRSRYIVHRPGAPNVPAYAERWVPGWA